MSEDICSKVPFFRIFLFFAAGIVVQSHAGLEQVHLLVLSSVLLPVLIVLHFLGGYRYPRFLPVLSGPLTLSLFLALGMTSVRQTIPAGHPPCVFTAIAGSLPVRRNAHIRLVLSDIVLKDQSARVPGKVLAYLEGDPASAGISPGDRLFLHGKLDLLAPPENPYEFNERDYYAGKGIYYRQFFPAGHWRIAGCEPARSIPVLAESWRLYFSARLDRLFPDQRINSLLHALYLGIKDYLDPADRERFANAGAMHFLAVSGLHTGIVCWLLNLLFSAVRLRQHSGMTYVLLMVLSLWLYALLTGLSIPVIRACFMLSLWLVSRLTHRGLNPLNTLFFAATAILVHNPSMIRDIGFQLSFMATGGLLLLFPVLHRLAGSSCRPADRLLSLVLISFVAQLSVFPLALHYFHRLPHYFILTNLLVTPLISILLCLAPLLLFSGPLSFVQVPAGFLIRHLARLLLTIVDFINGLPGSHSQGYYPSVTGVLLLYAVTGFLAVCLLTRTKTCLNILLLSVFLLLCEGTWRGIRQCNRCSLYVFHLPGRSAVNVLSGKRNILISGVDLQNSYDWERMTAFWSERNLQEPQFLNDRTGKNWSSGSACIRYCGNRHQGIWFIQMNSIRTGILESYNRDLPGAWESVPRLDCLVIRNNCVPRVSELPGLFGATTLVLDGSNSYSYCKDRESECRGMNLRVHLTHEQGCFTLKDHHPVRLRGGSGNREKKPVHELFPWNKY